MRVFAGSLIAALTLLLLTGTAGAGSFCFQIPNTGQCLQVSRDGSGTVTVVPTRQSAIEPQLGESNGASSPASTDAGATAGPAR